MSTAADRILDALASDYLLHLNNHKTEWSIEYHDEKGDRNKLADADFDGLLLRWYRELAIIEERASEQRQARSEAAS